MFSANGCYVFRELWATFKFSENHFSLEIQHKNIGFLKICKSDEPKTFSKVYDLAEFEAGHENCLRPQTYHTLNP